MKKKIKNPESKIITEIFRPHISKQSSDYFDTTVPAGFPSPALDAIQKKLDLNEYLISHPASTFFIRVKGDSMIGADIHSGDLLVIDRSLEAKHQDIILAIIDGSFTVKRFLKKSDGIYLQPENETYQAIKITEESDFQVWGVVTSVIKKFK